MAGKTALIIGMARSGVAGAKLLAADGYTVVINDMKKNIPGLAQQLAGIDYIDQLGEDPMDLLDGVDLMMLSPVVPIFKPFAQEAMARGVEVIGEIELGYRYLAPDVKLVCVSGTNGKTTTTALTGELFAAAGKRTWVLGNIGVPIAEKAPQTRPGDVVVAEVAALQLESIARFRPSAVGMLNITEDHLNRFAYSMQKYIAAKCRAFENQTPADYAVLNWDDPVVRDMARLTRAKVVWFSQTEPLEEGMFLREGRMVWRFAGEETALIHVEELRIPGAHNVQNALCAASLALCMGLDAAPVCEGLKGFAGVEHRIEFVREKGGIRYINDSKGTNPDSTIKAVQAMSGPTILLLGVGNYDKKSDFTPLFEAFDGKVRGVVASGCNIPAIQAAAAATGFSALKTCGDDLGQMVAMATDMAAPGYTVLLSPAAASWGVYEDYEQRGRIFKEIVNAL